MRVARVAGNRGHKRAAARVVVLAVLAAGCASEQGEWQNPNVPEEQWAQDKAACRRSASNEAEREFDLRRGSGPSLSYDPSGRWSQQMDRFSARQHEQQFFADCMQVRGYSRATPDTADAAVSPAAGAGAGAAASAEAPR